MKLVALLVAVACSLLASSAGSSPQSWSCRVERRCSQPDGSRTKLVGVGADPDRGAAGRCAARGGSAGPDLSWVCQQASE